MNDYRIEGDTLHFGEGLDIHVEAGTSTRAYIITWGDFDPEANTRREASRRRVNPGARIFKGDILVHIEPDYIRWAVYIGDKPAPINSTPPISSYQDADLFARDISGSIGNTNTVSVLGFTTPRSDDSSAGDVLTQYRDGQRVEH